MSDDNVAAAILAAAVVEKTTFAADTDIVREASVIFRKLKRAIGHVDEVNEKVGQRRQHSAPAAADG